VEGGTVKQETVSERYDALGSDYDRFTKVLDWGTSWMRKETLAKARGEVLEVAVGSGKNLRFYPPGSRIVGLDISGRLLDLAKRQAEQQKTAFEAHLGDATNMPFDARRFDTVVCTLGGCTFDDPQAIYREMRRVCHPHGQVLFVEHIRPPGVLMRLFCQSFAPISKRLLHCNPNRESIRYMEESGLHVAERKDSFAGMFVQLVMKP